MTTIQIQLPDQLAQDAERAGLLAPESVEKLLRDQLKAKRIEELFSATGRIRETAGPAKMTPEEVAEEMRAMRAEKRAKNRA